ncbi:MAG: ORF6N domain-containing protein [Candidatus Omnitrophota bacterium]
MSEMIVHEVVERKIYIIHGRKVMLDKDLAQLYKVPTKRLNEQVRRNIKRFPEDFMFQLTWEETKSLRSQFATLNKQPDTESKRGRHMKYLPNVFTEQGIAMLSSVLNSERAIQVNIVIMRVFVRLREILATHKELAIKIKDMERKVGEHDSYIYSILQIIKEFRTPTVEEKPKKKIGFHGE